MTVITPYESSVRPARTPGLGSLLRAEWTKLRTVRGFVIGLLLAAALPVAFTQLGHSTCSIGIAGNGVNGGRTFRSVACPTAPIGPDGIAVTDSFYFVHEALPASGSITARVTGIAGEYPSNGPGSSNPGMVPATQPWAKAGIMIKASATPGSAYAAMLITGSSGVRMQWDYTGDTAGLLGNASASSPRWLRLVRSGSVVSGYDSLNGTTWALVGRYDVHGLPATQTVQVGLFAASPSEQSNSPAFCHAGMCYDGSTLATGTFANVTAAGASGAWTGTTIGANEGPGVVPGVPNPSGTTFNGSYRQADPTSFTVTGSGEIGPDVPGGPDGIGVPAQAALTGVFAALIAVIIVAALFIAAEYRRGMIRVTLAAAPSRWRVLAAKSVVIFL
ncbi:MAG TPA: hypothetical protein VI365_35145, partial [Trebonia sp.]